MADLIGHSLGRYHILEQLGEGGMAVVYKAFDTLLEQDVAVKVIMPGREQKIKFFKRFAREARALAQLSHPNIVKVIDHGEHEGVPYLVMEYVPSGTLKKMLGWPLPYAKAAHLLAPIARALAYAHGKKIIHRDVKPSNILVTPSGQPVLSDFGIAKILQEDETADLTGTGVGIGTPEYMAPEQAQGKPVDARADIYSLGVVFYELITGRKPYFADTPLAVIWKVASDPLPRPSLFVPDLPETVEKILLKALSKNPDERYADMDSFAGVLEALASDASGKPGVVAGRRKAHTAQVDAESRHKARLLTVIIGVLSLALLITVGVLWKVTRPLSPAVGLPVILTDSLTYATQAPLPSQTATPLPTETDMQIMPAPSAYNADPAGDFLEDTGESYTDLLHASVEWQTSDLLQFSLQVAAPIPAAPESYLAYVWGIDADNDFATGYGRYYVFSNDIGIDILLRVAWAGGYWDAWVDKAGPNGVAEWSRPVGNYSIDGSAVTVIVSASEFGIPGSFSWTAHTIQGNQYFDIAPNSSHMHSP